MLLIGQFELTFAILATPILDYDISQEVVCWLNSIYKKLVLKSKDDELSIFAVPTSLDFLPIVCSVLAS